MSLSCTYCGRLILSEKLYDVHSKKCLKRNYEEQSSTSCTSIPSNDLLATFILNCSKEKKYITKSQFVKMLKFWALNVHKSDHTQYDFIMHLQHNVDNNKQIIYSIDDRKKILSQNNTYFHLNKENIT